MEFLSKDNNNQLGPLPLEITETVIVKGSQCSPFRGGDFFLFGEKNTVIIILDDEEEGTWYVTMATETKIQA